MMEGVDWGFVGPAYTAPDKYQDSQACINRYVEISQNGKSKTATALLGCPGLETVITFASVGPVRGSWVLPGGDRAIFVVGPTVYLATVTTPPSQTQIAQFVTANVGSLQSNSGPVSIRDNGAGGYVVIVDGPNGYYYRMTGVGSTSFMGTVTAGSNIITYTGALNTALVVGSVVRGVGVDFGSTIVSINTNLAQITLSLPAFGSSPGDTEIIATLAVFGTITDPGFLGADRVAFIDGWLIFNKPGTQSFYTTAPVPYTLLFDPLFFALKDSSSDNLITLQELNRELWLIGERASEIWFNAGGAQFAFQRVPGAAPPIGCAAVQSLAQMGDSLVWLGKNAQGENIVVQTQQYNWRRISNHGVESAISSYPLVSDAFGFAYEEEGHLFYLLIFPTADKCWTFDASTGEWHERLSYDQNTGLFHRPRANCFANFQNLRLVGDYQSGQVHRMSRKIYTDAGAPLVAIRRCPTIWSRENRQRVQMASVQIDYAPGVGLQNGQGVNPQSMLRFSRDGGANYGTERWRPIGKVGNTKNRAKWNRCGISFNTVIEERFSEPTCRDIVGATLYAQGTGS